MIRIFPDIESLSLAASELVAQKVYEAVKARGEASIVLSGGATPRRTYEILAQIHSRDRYFWKGIHFFWGDERCVPHDDERSNVRMTREALLDHISIDRTQLHLMQCGGTPMNDAKEYEWSIRQYFGDRPPVFDVVLLGLGDDGHTASLFPGSKAVEEKERWVADVHKNGEGFWRITMTPPLLNRAATVIFIVAGSSKGHILHEVLTVPPPPYHYPAQLIRPVGGQLIWLVDKEASYVLMNEPILAS